MPSMNVRSIICVLLCFGLSAVLESCAILWYNKIEVSTPTSLNAASDGWRIVPGKNVWWGTTLTNDQLAVTVIPRNYQGRGGPALFIYFGIPIPTVTPHYGRFETVGSFYVDLFFSWQAEDISLDPAEVTLSITDPGASLGPEATFKPIISKGPYKGVTGSWLGGTRLYCDTAEMGVQGDAPKEFQTCLTLQFEIPPPQPGTEFSLQIKGLQISGQAVSLPIINFSKGTGHSMTGPKDIDGDHRVQAWH